MGESEGEISYFGNFKNYMSYDTKGVEVRILKFA